MKKVLPYLPFTLSLLFLSCHDTGPVLSGCCTKPGNFVDVGVGEISIPNIFTPNADGIGDRLWVFGDSIKQINYLRITNRKDEVAFEVHNVPTDDISSAWDGMIDGQVEKGVYTIELEAEGIDGYLAVYTGQVCNFICDDSDIVESVDLSNCVYECQIWSALNGYQPCLADYLPCME